MTDSDPSNGESNHGGDDNARRETIRFRRQTDTAKEPRPALDLLLANQSSAPPQETTVSSMAKTEVECFDAMSLGWIIPTPDNLSDNIKPDQQRRTDTDSRATTDNEYMTIDTGWALSNTDSKFIILEPLNYVSQGVDVYPTVLSSGERITVRILNSNPKAIDPGEPLCQLLPLTNESETASCSIQKIEQDDLIAVNRGDNWTKSRKEEYVRDRTADHYFSTDHTGGKQTD